MKILEVPLPKRPVVPEDEMGNIPVQSGAIEILLGLFKRGFEELGHECEIYGEHEKWEKWRKHYRDWVTSSDTIIDSILQEGEDIDIIHIHAYATMENPKWKMLKQKVVYTWHDSPFEMIGQRFKIAILVDMMEEQDIHVVGISKFQTEQWRIPFIYNGIDLDQFYWQLPRTERYLSIGRIVPEKGQDIAIDSALLTDSELDVVGNRYHGPFWASTIRPKIEKSKKIKFHGPVYGERKRALFSRCKALLSPIRWEEPFGLTFVEVLASGAPVIGFAKGATREVVGNCGRFFTSAPDLRRFMNRRPNLSSMEFLSPENCRLQSSKFSYKRMCKEYINFFQNIL